MKKNNLIKNVMASRRRGHPACPAKLAKLEGVDKRRLGYKINTK
jgi:hypothetical protein